MGVYMKRIYAVVVAFAMLMLGTAPAYACGHSHHTKKVHKSYVCKYVGKPGVDERLQTGKNPIWVDNHALLGHDGLVSVGDEFKDRHVKSVVIVANTPKLNPEPTIDQCPAPQGPPPADEFYDETVVSEPNCETGLITTTVTHFEVTYTWDEQTREYVANAPVVIGTDVTTTPVATEQCPTPPPSVGKAVLKIKAFTGCAKSRRSLEVLKRHNIASLHITNNAKKTRWVVKAETKPDTLMHAHKNGTGKLVDHVKWVFRTLVPKGCAPHPHGS
jgi:hypothetical protein